MQLPMRRGAILGLALILLGCASPQARDASSVSPEVQRPAGPKRITVAITGNPTVLSFGLIGGGARGGVDAIEELVHAGLAINASTGGLETRLGEAVPSLENGLWRLLPDGRMETTWRIKSGAAWHDGTPLTADDLVFTTVVGQDREAPQFSHIGYSSVESVEASDPRTVKVTWRRAYIQADTMFTRDFASPLPRHLLESVFVADKANLLQHPYWNRDFVGTGPYRVREYESGSHMVLVANEGYLMGRPKLDEVVVKFIPDNNAILANVLAGEVDVTLGFGLSLDQGMQAREQWRDGKLELAYKTWVLMHPQMISPNPAVITDVQFRRALMHAMNREEMAQAIQYGLVPVAHSSLNPSGADYREVERAIARYDYDPRRAAQLIEGLGYTRGPDGSFRDASDQRLNLEIIAGAGLDITMKSMFAVADYWQRLGIAVDPVVVPVQRARDREYHATRRGFELTRTSSDLRFPPRMHTREVPLPENGFNGSNNSRYSNPEYDSLVDRYSMTVPTQERTDLVRQIIGHLTDRVIPMGLFFDTEPMLIANRLQGVAAVQAERSVSSWNVHEWDLR